MPSSVVQRARAAAPSMVWLAAFWIGILALVVLSARHVETPTSRQCHSAALESAQIQSSQLRPGSSVVERGPEKAGVGGSIPSLATILFQYFVPHGRALAVKRSKVVSPAALQRPASARFNPVPWPPFSQYFVPHGRALAVKRSKVVSPAALRKAVCSHGWNGPGSALRRCQSAVPTPTRLSTSSSAARAKKGTWRTGQTLAGHW